MGTERQIEGKTEKFNKGKWYMKCDDNMPSCIWVHN
jgi:hypothetical protein